MKHTLKQCAALVLAFLLCLSMMPVAMALPPSTPTHNDHLVCGVSCSHGGTHSAVTDWKPLDLSSSEWLNGYQLQQSGSYYLTEDLNLTDALTFYAETAAKAITVNICLNGHSITKGNDAAITINQYVTLNICNCGDTGKISNGITVGSPQGAGNNVLNLYDIDIVNEINSRRGLLARKGAINMYGGSVESVYYGVQLQGGTFTLYDGSVKGGTSSICVDDGTAVLKGGKITTTGTSCVRLLQLVDQQTLEPLPLSAKTGLSLEGAVTFEGGSTYSIYVNRPLDSAKANAAVFNNGYTGSKLTVGVGNKAEDGGYLVSGSSDVDTKFEGAFDGANWYNDLEIFSDDTYLWVGAKGSTPPVPGHDHPVCGASCSSSSHSVLTGWKKLTWDSTNSKLLADGAAVTQDSSSDYYTLNGNYYLGGDIPAGIKVKTTASVLCLNGYSISSSSGDAALLLDSDTNLTVTDCKTTGEIENTSSGNAVDVGYAGHENSVFTLYNGTLKSATGYAYGDNGGTNNTFYQYGGTVVSGGNHAAFVGNGSEQHYYLYGGSVKNTNSAWAVCVMADDATLSISGEVSITGNIWVSNPITIAGALTKNSPKYTVRFTESSGSDKTGTFTSGWNAKMSSAAFDNYFVAYKSNTYEIKKTDDGAELQMVRKGASQPTTCTVSLSANPADGGTVTGGGTYAPGTSITITATPNSGYAFVCWKDAVFGTTVSTDATYTFTASNRTLVAVFEATGGGNGPAPIDPTVPGNLPMLINPAKAPVVTEPVEDQLAVACVDSTVTMQVETENDGSYQWYVDRGNGFVPIAGANKPSYTTSPVELDNDGYRYYCKVTNRHGSDVSPIFTLAVVEYLDVPKTGGTSGSLFAGIALLALAAGCACMGSRKKNGSVR